MPETPLARGSTIGILGGGQLGRMLAEAAEKLGFECHIYCPEADAPALQVADGTTADYKDTDALAAFAEKADVITYEFENIPPETVKTLAETCNVFPSAHALEMTQDRLHEKQFLTELGIAVAQFHPVDDAPSLAAALDDLGGHGILKTRRFGYDGKGQWRITPESDTETLMKELDGRAAILEAVVAFDTEASLIVARGRDGEIKLYDPIENRHENHILRHSSLPARFTADQRKAAEAMAHKIVAALDYVGVLAVELFVSGDGLRVNELAPRVHNSGHATLDACACSQFEQHIRAIAGMSLGDTQRHADAVMTNILGDEISEWQDRKDKPDMRLHLYGKAEARKGRKMGHVTELKPKSAR